MELLQRAENSNHIPGKGCNDRPEDHFRLQCSVLIQAFVPIHEIPFYQHILQFRYYLYQYKRHQKPLPFLHVRKYIDKVSF